MLRKISYLLAAAAASAGLALAGAGGASATAVRVHPDATVPCSTFCYDLSNQMLGPLDVQTLVSTPKSGTHLQMQLADNTRPYQDFSPSFTGIVGNKTIPLSACGQHLIAASSKLCLDGLYSGDAAWQMQYSPYGNSTNLCVGAKVAEYGAVQLQPCQDKSTIWVADSAHPSGGSYTPWINAADTSFANPYSLNVGSKDYLDMARQNPSLGTVSDRKQFEATPGPAS